MTTNGKLPSRRKHWTAEEDSAIISLMSESIEYSWAEIAKILSDDFGLSGRTSKQCRERWCNHLDPNLKKAKWTTEELLALFTAHNEHGNKWTLIRDSLSGRSENCIKNQFYSYLRRQFRKWKGREPQRQQLKKYGSALASQVLALLKKKTRNVDQERTLADIDPVLTCEEETDESISIFDIEFFPTYLTEMF